MNALNGRYPVEFDDIQALLRYGHGRLSESAFLLLRIEEPAAARQWLATAPITRAKPASPLPDTALQVAFTATGLKRMGLDDRIIGEFSEEFISGMSGDDNRSRRLGDTGSNHPQAWCWGGTSQDTPHLLLLVYAAAGKLDNYLAQIRSERFTKAFAIQQELNATATGPEEPFGFVDGISQPQLDWQQSVDTDPHQRDRYSNRLALGEVLLGYPNEYALYTARPLLNPGSQPHARALPTAAEQPGLMDLGRNGTYLVLRQLAQDVGGFWQFLDQQTGSDPHQREQLAAAMVGRQRDGTPLIKGPDEQVSGKGSGSTGNRFNFEGDPHGLACPVGAHIRRANPRTGDFPPGVNGTVTRLIRTLGFGERYPGDDLVAASRFHRILRRGRAYGSKISTAQALLEPPGDKPRDERGLYFICLGGNISRQFEFVQNAWAMSAKFAGLPTESDPLLGNRQPLASGAATNSFSLPQRDAPARRIEALPQFVTVRGGAYFFMPGMRALAFILQQTQDGQEQ
jgi:Dyp-type peroxidase family